LPFIPWIYPRSTHLSFKVKQIQARAFYCPRFVIREQLGETSISRILRSRDYSGEVTWKGYKVHDFQTEYFIAGPGRQGKLEDQEKDGPTSF
jgi:hypothetical protein